MIRILQDILNIIRSLFNRDRVSRLNTQEPDNINFNTIPGRQNVIPQLATITDNNFLSVPSNQGLQPLDSPNNAETIIKDIQSLCDLANIECVVVNDDT